MSKSKLVRYHRQKKKAVMAIIRTDTFHKEILQKRSKSVNKNKWKRPKYKEPRLKMLHLELSEDLAFFCPSS